MFLKRFTLIIPAALIASALHCFSQVPDYPVEGTPCPNFRLEGVEYFGKESVSLDDFRGKWLVLYFWTAGCPAGVGGLKDMSDLQRKFEDDLQILLIAKNDERNKNIRQLYEKFRAQYRYYKLPIVYETKLFEQFVGEAPIPHVVIVTPDGVVYAVTEAFEVTSEAITRLLSREAVDFSHKHNAYDVTQKPVARLYKPFYANENAGSDTDFIYRSLLSKYDPRYAIMVTSTLKEQTSKGQFQCIGLSVPALYKYAYIGSGNWTSRDSLYGLFSNEVAIEVSEPAKLEAHGSSGRGRYNYSVIVPPEKASESFIQEVMRRDLKNYFGYRISIESRPTEVWKLVTGVRENITYADPSAEESHYVDHATLRMQSGNTQQLLWILSSYNQSHMLVDSTGLTRNIQMKIDGDLANFDLVRKEIEKTGFRFLKDSVQMKVLVIRDQP